MNKIHYVRCSTHGNRLVHIDRQTVDESKGDCGEIIDPSWWKMHQGSVSDRCVMPEDFKQAFDRTKDRRQDRDKKSAYYGKRSGSERIYSDEVPMACDFFKEQYGGIPTLHSLCLSKKEFRRLNEKT